jgi:hypothetical protein
MVPLFVFRRYRDMILFQITSLHDEGFLILIRPPFLLSLLSYFLQWTDFVGVVFLTWLSFQCGHRPNILGTAHLLSSPWAGRASYAMNADFVGSAGFLAPATIEVRTVRTVDRCYNFRRTMHLPKLPRCALDGARTSFDPAREGRLDPAALGMIIITIQIQGAAEQFGWKRCFFRVSDESKSALRRVVASLDLWNGCPIGTSETAITLASVFGK